MVERVLLGCLDKEGSLLISYRLVYSIQVINQGTNHGVIISTRALGTSHLN